MNAWSDRFRSAFGSLKFRITAGGLVALVLGIGVFAVLLVNRAERDTLRTQRQRELTETSRTAVLLWRNVVDLQRDLRALADRLDKPTLADDDKLATFIEEQPVLRARFDVLFVAAPEGRTRVLIEANGNRHAPVELKDREYFRRTLAEDRPVVSEMIASRVSGDPIVVLTQPVHSPGGMVAVIGAALKISDGDMISDLVNQDPTDATTLNVVTDARGLVIAHPDRRLVMHPVTEEPRLAQAYADWVARGRPIDPDGIELKQPRELVSAAGVRGPDWMVWRVRPEAELLAPLRAARREAMVWAAGLIVLLSTGLLGLLRWLLRPLVRLEQRAQHLFDDHDDSHGGWPVTGGEIGRLGRVLRHVAAERAQLESFNTQVLRKLSSVMNAAPIGIAFTRDQRFELVSAEFCRLLGRNESLLIGQPTRIIYASDEDFTRLGPLVGAAFAANRAYAGDWQMLRADGTPFWASLRGNPVDAEDASAGTIWTVADISDQRIENEQLAWSATHDTLTGLANRKLFEKRACGIVADGMPALPATLVFIDLDRFKPINDSAGHAAGDAVLKAVAAALLPTVRASDLVARLGGDEFALLLEHCGHEVALRIAENARAAICAIALPWEGRTLGVGASFGIAGLNAEMSDLTAWVGAADAACYSAKAAGRGVIRSATFDRAPAAREDSAAIS